MYSIDPKVLITGAAAEDFRELPTAIKPRVRKVLVRLRFWPEVSGVKPLSGPLAGYYRIRTGSYRVVFRVEPDAVVVVKIGHRDRFYG